MKSSMLLLFKVALTILVLGHLWTSSCTDVSEDDWELEKQLKTLNKPSIKTFKTTEGETIDCVNIYTQPALDHPLLKNHKIQLSPTFLASSPENSQNVKSNLHKLREPCPNGTVPIVRVDKHDLVRAQSLPQELSSRSERINSGRLHSMYLTISTQGIRMYGGGGRTSVYNLSVNNDQYSSVQLWIQSHSMDMILTGWRVYPELNGDGLTRLFTYWVRSNKGGCYNTLCPGYVQVDSVVTPNYPLIKTSTRGKVSMELHFEVKQDRQTGNWWFVIGRPPKQFGIGYWPKALFDNLANGCDWISYGGAVKAGRYGRLPPLGSGYFPDGNYLNSCYFADLHYIDSRNEYKLLPEKQIDLHEDRCYGFKYFGFISSPPYHYNIQLGGPGGTCFM